MSSKDVKVEQNISFIRRFVEVCGSSQPADVARLLNISYQAAKNYLQGRLPDSNVLISISRQTPYSIHWLLTGKGEKFAEINLQKDTPQLSDHLRALIKDECQKVVGEILGVSVEDAQGRVIVLKSEEIKDEKIIDESNTSPTKKSQ
jgi:hypothetical protein